MKGEKEEEEGSEGRETTNGMHVLQMIQDINWKCLRF